MECISCPKQIIKNLEEYLDVKLYHRGPRKIALTNAGELLFN
ncbi:MAG: LysR family transcriptional regulator [Tepidanaerobacteraceae bacterium]|jgi:DNA-binding transcriptional LysR family regulator